MSDEAANSSYGQDEDMADATMTEGVGGLPNLDDEERASVTDVDGDNVDEGEELNPEASTYGAP